MAQGLAGADAVGCPEMRLCGKTWPTGGDVAATGSPAREVRRWAELVVDPVQ